MLQGKYKLRTIYLNVTYVNLLENLKGRVPSSLRADVADSKGSSDNFTVTTSNVTPKRGFPPS